jgi:recombinational DNA repair ATPase RecF
MRLMKFRVTDYRSIKDSGDVQVAQRTALVGRNESGKTNLLLAVKALNPPESGPAALNKVKDAPRTKRLSDFADGTRFLESEWELTDAEQQAITEACPSLRGVTIVNTKMSYDG